MTALSMTSAPRNPIVTGVRSADGTSMDDSVSPSWTTVRVAPCAFGGNWTVARMSVGVSPSGTGIVTVVEPCWPGKARFSPAPSESRLRVGAAETIPPSPGAAPACGAAIMAGAAANIAVVIAANRRSNRECAVVITAILSSNHYLAPDERAFSFTVPENAQVTCEDRRLSARPGLIRREICVPANTRVAGRFPADQRAGRFDNGVVRGVT